MPSLIASRKGSSLLARAAAEGDGRRSVEPGLSAGFASTRTRRTIRRPIPVRREISRVPRRSARSTRIRASSSGVSGTARTLTGSGFCAGAGVSGVGVSGVWSRSGVVSSSFFVVTIVLLHVHG